MGLAEFGREELSLPEHGLLTTMRALLDDEKTFDNPVFSVLAGSAWSGLSLL